MNSQGAWEFCSQFTYRPAGVINIYRKDRETVKKSFPGHSLTSSHGPEQQARKKWRLDGAPLLALGMCVRWGCPRVDQFCTPLS